MAGGASFLNGVVPIIGRVLQPGPQSLHMLVRFADFIRFSVFDKNVARTQKGKGHPVPGALVIERLDPLIIKGPLAVVVFAFGQYGFQLAGGQIRR